MIRSANECGQAAREVKGLSVNKLLDLFSWDYCALPDTEKCPNHNVANPDSKGI